MIEFILFQLLYVIPAVIVGAFCYSNIKEDLEEELKVFKYSVTFTRGTIVTCAFLTLIPVLNLILSLIVIGKFCVENNILKAKWIQFIDWMNKPLVDKR